MQGNPVKEFSRAARVLSREYHLSLSDPKEVMTEGTNVLQRASCDFYSRSISGESIDGCAGSPEILHSMSSRMTISMIDCSGCILHCPGARSAIHKDATHLCSSWRNRHQCSAKSEYGCRASPSAGNSYQSVKTTLWKTTRSETWLERSGNCVLSPRWNPDEFGGTSALYLYSDK